MIPAAVSLFDQLYSAHEALGEAETLRADDHDLVKKQAKDSNLHELRTAGGQVRGKRRKEEFVTQKAQKAWDLGRNDPGGIEELYIKREQAVLGAIGNAVQHLAKEGVEIDWRARNAEEMVDLLRQQLVQLSRTPQFNIPQLVKLFEQDIVTHQDQFSRNFYLFAKEHAAGDDDLSKASARCVSLFKALREELERASTTKQSRQKRIDNPQMQACIKKFAEAFKVIKEVSIQISIEQARNFLACPVCK